MTPEIDLAIPGSIKTPPTVGMTTIDLLNHGDPEGALLECADGVEGGRISLLRRECQSNDGSDKERNLRAIHVTALPRGGDTYHSKGAADRLRLFRWRPTAYCAYTLRLNDPPRLFPLNSIASLMSALSQEDPFGCYLHWH
jgi:hypothetical protein